MLQYILDTIQEVAHKYDVSSWLIEKTLRCESVNFKWSVIIGEELGAAGEQGIAQLHPEGMLPVFYKLGYESPFSIGNAVDFVGWAFSQGLGWHWTCHNFVIRGMYIFN